MVENKIYFLRKLFGMYKFMNNTVFANLYIYIYIYRERERETYIVYPDGCLDSNWSDRFNTIKYKKRNMPKRTLQTTL